jgi:hypothetical protein
MDERAEDNQRGPRVSFAAGEREVKISNLDFSPFTFHLSPLTFSLFTFHLSLFHFSPLVSRIIHLLLLKAVNQIKQGG